jgi:hypothetical protein
MRRITCVLLSAAFLTMCIVAMPAGASAQAPQGQHITTPKEHFGFNIGDDYCLANYTQLQSYWAKLEKESNRLKVVEIGKTEEGRPQLMGIVTSPANHAKLEHYRKIAKRMADAEGVSKEEAAKLAEEGKAVVWIDGGLHASEVLCAQMLMETMYQYLIADDPESLRILDDVIILFVHANPDGMELLADSYMKKTKAGRLYQKYIGHDNNRDSFGNTQSETKNMNRIMYREWLPQIVFNHHQTGPGGTVLFCPPFRDPANYNIDSLVLNGIDRVGAAIMERFLVEHKPGATTRTGAPYSGWWNGGVRTTSTFHNMIGLLTETIGNPTPTSIGLNPDKQLRNGDYLAPIEPQVWHFRQSVDYSVSSNKAVLDYASRNRRHMLYDIWRMGMNSIEKGSKDSWTITPKIVNAAKAQGGGGGGFKKGAAGGAKEFERFFRKPENRDPRGFILPSNQPDFLTATKFINALMGTGVRVWRATSDFKVGDKEYPKGSYVVKSAQSFRPHVLDMFEPQDHPDDIPYEGAAPRRPYDATGWTMAFTMAVKFDRILTGLDGPFEEIKDIAVPPPPGTVTAADNAAGFYLDTRVNDAFRAVNQMHAAGQEVRRLQAPSDSKPAGTFFIPRTEKTVALLAKIAKELGTSFEGTKTDPGKDAAVVKPVRIALWDQGGGSMPSGWTRWIFEKMEFPFKVVKGGGSLDEYDVLVLPDGGSWDTSTAKKFIENGGTVLAVGSATSIGSQLGLPLSKQAVKQGDKYYIPMSVLRVKTNTSDPLAWGMEEYTDVMFNNSPTFKITPEAMEKFGMTKLAWFDTKTPLRSGWALGQQQLEGGVAMVDVKMGKGRLALFGPQVTFRAQPHGTFKLLFNGIVQAGVKG